MRKILYSTLLALAACFSANAQGVKIENLQTEISGQMLDISFDLRASELDLKCNGELTLEFAVEGTDRRLVLPVVVYSGNLRYRYEQRAAALSGEYRVEPYHIEKGIKKDKTYDLNYKLSIPYYTWMEHAAVTYREYTHDCSGDNLSGNGVLIADLNPAPVYVEPEIWAPNPAHYPNLVSFLQPEVEEVKSRASLIELHIGFAVNATDVRPTFGNNAAELQRADSLITEISTNPLLTINGIEIRGYASPEGKYAANERLAQGRSEGFKRHLAAKYPANIHLRNAHTSWVAEDWEGLARLVEKSDLPRKKDVLAVVLNGAMAPDTKEATLKQIQPWSEVYKPMLDNLFPKLRRIELKVDYTVQKLDDNKARELTYTQPEMLSLDEIYRVARFYGPGDEQYGRIYEIAARQYPDDVIANNNAAAALLQSGNAEAALPYLEKSGDALINYGAYYYILGDLEKATEYFNRAKDAGIEQAGHNLELIK